MALSPRLIKRRIKSVANTRKITKAMELVSASKMRKAVQLTIASRAYSGTTKKLVDEIRKHVDSNAHPFLVGAQGTGGEAQTLLIVAASDRGLCGGFNAQVLKKALEFLRSRGEQRVQIITVGRRAESSVRRAGYTILASFDAISNAPSFEAAMPIGRMAVKEFTSGAFNRVFVAYTDFKSALTQIPMVEQLLPIIPENELSASGVGSSLSDDRSSRAFDDDDPGPYDEDGRRLAATLPDPSDESSILFEPSPSYVLDQLLPRLVETRIYQALLESSASEHSARMMSMRNATDNASGMLDDLKFTYNQARQAGITREISEISAGKAALE